MSRHRSLIFSIVLILCVLPAIAGGPGNGHGAGSGPRAGGPPIHNKVVDLLDEEMFLNSDDAASWISEPFRTARFNRAILKTATEVDGGFLRCYTEWKFTPDDEFQALGPPPSVIGDDVTPRVVPSTGPDAYLVYGLIARVRCDLLPPPDFGVGDPPPPATGSLTDVKVLLRRE